MDEPKLFTIADGVDFVAVRTDLFKTCRINVQIALPLCGDIAAKAVLPQILRRSCRRYPDFTSLNGHLDMLYGATLSASVGKLGDAQLLNLSISSIDDRFVPDGGSVAEEAVELLAQLLFEPKLENGTFCLSDVDVEKRLLLERMRAEDDDKRAYARRRCTELMCENELFGKNRFGTAEQIESLTPQRVFDAWREALETARIRFVFVSSGEADNVQAILRTQFAAIERRVCDIRTQFVQSAQTVRYERETQPLMQGTLVMGFRCGMTHEFDNDPAVTVMADVFGGGTYSRLFSVVREKMSLCYFCRAQLNRKKGILMVASGIETENEEKTREAILHELREIQDGVVTQEMLDMSVRSLCDTIRGYTDSPDTLCAWYGVQILHAALKTPAQRIAEIRTVEPAQVQKAAQAVTLDTVFMLAGTGEKHHD